MINVLVTGGNGQLGHSLKDKIQLRNNIRGTFIDIDELDLRDKEAVEQYFESENFDIVVNCAAYTAVDRAEDEQELAREINIDTIVNIGLVAEKKGLKVIHISTDYVFDGESDYPYKESDAANPKTVYGQTKLAGEQLLLKIHPESVIIRTAWLYSSYGKNFFLTMRNKAIKEESVKVVNDQHGSPTLALDLANVILDIIEFPEWKSGIYHFTNGGETTWFEFTKEIYTLLGADPTLVSPISSDKYKSKAVRPKFSVLDTSKIRTTFSLEIPDWKESLKTIAQNGI